MQPTRRFWEALAVAAVLAAAALVFARPLLLVATAGVCALLLASQLAFVYAVGRLEDSLAVTQTVATEGTVTDDPVTATLEATGDAGGLRATVTARPSAGLEADGDLQTPLGEATSYTVRSDVAGTHSLRSPAIAVADPAGLFTERFARGDAVDLSIDARQPRNVHVGEGGTALPVAFGYHTLESTGQGLTPAELRKYVAGEAASRIDWKATARLDTPYVRKFEAESDRTTVVVFDARAGRTDDDRDAPVAPDESALEYLRTVALSHVSIAQRLADPVAVFGVDDRGVHRLAGPTNAARGYELARHRLGEFGAATEPSRPRHAPPVRTRGASYDAETRFGRVLGAFAAARPALDPETEPLQAAIRAALSSTAGSAQVTVFTDDDDRAGVRQAAAAVRGSDYTLDVFMAPAVLFEPDPLADLAASTERYRGFERFRRDVHEIDGVAAYEVGPRNRIETVLERQRRPARS